MRSLKKTLYAGKILSVFKNYMYQRECKEKKLNVLECSTVG